MYRVSFRWDICPPWSETSVEGGGVREISGVLWKPLYFGLNLMLKSTNDTCSSRLNETLPPSSPANRKSALWLALACL